MKLEKFKKYGKRNKKIICSVIGIIVLICGVLLLKSFAFFESKYDFNVIKGRIPEFNGGDIQLAFTIDGVKSNNAFPVKDFKYVSKNVTCSNGITAGWDNETWSLVNINSNGNKKISCIIDFRTATLYDYVKIGDLVSYTPNNTNYIISKTLTNYSSDQTINPSELDLWRVIKKNEDGTIDMVSEYTSSTNVNFYDIKGYNNYINTLNEIAKQYEIEGITNGSRYPDYNSIDGNLVTAAMPLDVGLKAMKKGTITYSNYLSSNINRIYVPSTYNRYYLGLINQNGKFYWSEPTYEGVENRVPNEIRKVIGGNVRILVILHHKIVIKEGNGSSSSPWKIN